MAAADVAGDNASYRVLGFASSTYQQHECTGMNSLNENK
jgi:hypothetical protein